MRERACGLPEYDTRGHMPCPIVYPSPRLRVARKGLDYLHRRIANAGTRPRTRRSRGVAMKRCAVYARYSSDLQSATSIEDQLRLCRDYAERQGWEITAT